MKCRAIPGDETQLFLCITRVVERCFNFLPGLGPLFEKAYLAPPAQPVYCVYKEQAMWPIISPLVTIIALKRTCPRCGKSQVVPREKRHETVPCKHCGAPVPPEKPKL